MPRSVLADAGMDAREHLWLEGVWCYPFSASTHRNRTWLRNLRGGGRPRCNFNGFVFRLDKQDFPLIAGQWFTNKNNPKAARCRSSEDLARRFGKMLAMPVINRLPAKRKPSRPTLFLDAFCDADGQPTGILTADEIPAEHADSWREDFFELIIPHRIHPSRIVKVIKSREPKKAERGADWRRDLQD